MSSTSPLAAASSDTKYKRRYWTLAVLSISLIVIALDVTVLNVAIPTLQRDLGASAASLQWILNAYILVFAGLLLTMGTLGDRFGRRRALETGLILFGIASLAAAYSQTSGQLIAARAAQGIGGAMIMPSTLSVLVDVFPRDERAKAIGIWAGVAAIGVPLGMIVGGWLLENFWWGTAFLINLPVVGIALVFGRFVVPESRDPGARTIDLVGAALSMFALTALVYTIIEAPERGWLDPLTLGGFVAVLISGAAFVRYELGQEHPMLDVRVFKNARLSSGSLAMAIMSMSMLAAMFLLTQYLQFVQGYSPLDTGIRLVPMAVGFMFGAPMSAALVGRIGTKWTVTLGLLILAAAVTSLSMLDVNTAYWVAGVSLFFFGMGGANTMAPATDAVMAALPDSHAGVGSAINDTVRQVGGALGIGIFGSILNSLYASNITASVVDLSADMSIAARNSIGGALQAASSLNEAGSQSLLNTANAAYVDAASVVYIVTAVIAVAGAVVTARFMPAHDVDLSEADVPVITLQAPQAGAVPAPVPIRIDEG